MKRHYQMIVFDWDGTVMDSASAIVESIQAACRDLGVAPPPDAQARHVIGLGLGDALRHAVPDLPESRHGEMVERYRHHYLSRDHELRLFDGMRELIEELGGRGLLLAIATGKSRLGLDRALAHSGLSVNFVASRCADECFSKPHPQMLLELMDEYALAADHLLMIGDTTHDLQMAANANVDAVGVAYGAHPKSALEACAPRGVVESVDELAAWLRSCV
jgi:phosphoglycolate phosphatase